jgi:hypothetical protein
MRINKLLRLGRLEIYIGRRPHWSPEWRANRIALGYGLWLGHWNLLACWLPSKRELARQREAWLAEQEAELDAKRLARARLSWPARCTP